MTSSSPDRARMKAAFAAVLLLLTGAVFGVAVDRVWLTPRADAQELTADALSEHLGLTPAEAGRMRALLDSIEPGIADAALHGPDSLQATAARAHTRIEDALPAGSRAEFRDWIRSHHDELQQRMHGGRMGH